MELTYQIEAPSQVNLQCLYNKVAYAHWSAPLYRRGEKPQVLHSVVTVSLND